MMRSSWDDDDDDLGLLNNAGAKAQTVTAGRRRHADEKAPEALGVRNFSLDLERPGPGASDLADAEQVATGSAPDGAAPAVYQGSDPLGGAQGQAETAAASNIHSWDEEDAAPAAPPQPPPVTAGPGPPQLAAAKSNSRGPRADLLRFLDDEDETDAKPGSSDVSGQAGLAKTANRRQLAQQEQAKQERDNKYAVEKELDIETLQELDDAGKVDLTKVVADAPKVHQAQAVYSLHDLESNRLRTLKQYIAEMLMRGKHAASDSEAAAADLNLLLASLLPEDQVGESDDFWDENLLLTAVASDMQTEAEERAAQSLGGPATQ